MDVAESLTFIADLDIRLGISLDGRLIIPCMDDLMDE